MRFSRQMFFLLLSGLVTGALVLIFVYLLLPRQHNTALPIVSLGLLICALFFLIFYHFTSGKAAENDRLSLQQRLNFLVEHIKDYAIFLIDPEGRVMSWNVGAQQIKGYTEAEIIGQPISVFY